MILTNIFTKVHGTRFTEKYLQARQQFSRSTYSYAPSFPPRSPAKVPASPKAAVTPGSPPRKVVTDFAAFGAPANASVFGTAVASTPFSLAGGKAAFGGIRGGGARTTSWDEEEDDDDDGRQRVELREDSISLDQVCGFLDVSDTPLTRFVDRPGASPCRAHGAAPTLDMSLPPIIS